MGNGRVQLSGRYCSGPTLVGSSWVCFSFGFYAQHIRVSNGAYAVEGSFDVSVDNYLHSYCSANQAFTDDGRHESAINLRIPSSVIEQSGNVQTTVIVTAW